MPSYLAAGRCKPVLLVVFQGFFGDNTSSLDERDELHFLPRKTFRKLKNCKVKEERPKGIQKMLQDIKLRLETLEKIQAKLSTL